MSRPSLRAFRATTTDAGEISRLSSPYDDLNQQIIRLLQEDGREAYDVIGQKLGVSGGTIRNRVTRMRDAGMLRIVAVVDPVAVDYEADAMLGIKTAPGVAPTAVAQRLDPHQAVVYVMWVSGSTCWSRSCATRKPSSRPSSTTTSTASPISPTSRS